MSHATPAVISSSLQDIQGISVDASCHALHSDSQRLNCTCSANGCRGSQGQIHPRGNLSGGRGLVELKAILGGLRNASIVLAHPFGDFGGAEG